MKNAGWLALGAAVLGLLAMSSGVRRRVHRAGGAAGRSLAELKKAIVGNSRGAVAAVFGPPRAMLGNKSVKELRDYWNADTWYYPLDPGRRVAVAIRFRGNMADGVEFIAGPPQRD
jgi:hypothetical protein